MDKRIKILFTISNFDTAGSSRVVYDLVKGLDNTLFDVEIACGHDKGTYFKEVKKLGIPIHVFSTKTSYRPYITLLPRLFKISRFYKRQGYDIVHSWQWSSDWTEALAAKIVGVKWIYTKKAMGFGNWHWKFKSRLADFIITINDDMHLYFPKKKNQRLIPLGIDVDYYKPSKRENTPPQTAFRLVMVANLVAVKGLEVLLEAMASLHRSDVGLKVVGKCDNDYGLAMQHRVKAMGLGKQITFEGKQTDVRPYLQDADVFVIPTLDEGRREGMPMALVEAMSMGVPVLGSRITGITFVLRDFERLLFEPNNPQDLADKLLQMMQLGPNERARLGSDLRNYCVTHFSIDHFVSAHEALYQELMT